MQNNKAETVKVANKGKYLLLLLVFVAASAPAQIIVDPTKYLRYTDIWSALNRRLWAATATV